MTAAPETEPLVSPPPTATGGLNRPWRALVAALEMVLAAAAVWGAFWAWPNGVVTISMTVDGTVLESTRFAGNWMAAAIGFGTLATLLVLDAIRQTVLAVRARPRHVKES